MNKTNRRRIPMLNIIFGSSKWIYDNFNNESDCLIELVDPYKEPIINQLCGDNVYILAVPYIVVDDKITMTIECLCNNIKKERNTNIERFIVYINKVLSTKELASFEFSLSDIERINNVDVVLISPFK